MEEKVERGRINIYLTKELKDYVDNSAREFGISTSAFMTMMIQNYKQQNEAIKVMGDMNLILSKLDLLEKKIKN